MTIPITIPKVDHIQDTSELSGFLAATSHPISCDVLCARSALIHQSFTPVYDTSVYHYPSTITNIESTIITEDSHHFKQNQLQIDNMEFRSGDVVIQSFNENDHESLLGSSCANTSQVNPSQELGTDIRFRRTFPSINGNNRGGADTNDIADIRDTQLHNSKPSEALFVRALIGRCKRIAPLWFRGVSSMRERNREENRRMANNNGQTQNDWSLIGQKISEMDTVCETEAVANLLKKLYKELPAEAVFWFLKCWLCSEDSLQDPESCVLSRGDAKGRMRRIDGGKGSDKVWRLDTIVGMLFHGLPMSSTDTNIMVHTCDQELCVRPQHIRFRASSVALVVVLKALAQAGYTIVPPPVAAGPNGVAPNASDESVDVFGPFKIDELQRYRSENLTPAGDSSQKLTLSAGDREFAESVAVIRIALQETGRVIDQTVLRNPSAMTISPAVSSSTIAMDVLSSTVSTGGSGQMNGYHPHHHSLTASAHGFHNVIKTDPDSLTPITNHIPPDGLSPSFLSHASSSGPITQSPYHLHQHHAPFHELPIDMKQTMATTTTTPYIGVQSPSSPVVPINSTHPPSHATRMIPRRMDRRSLKRPAPSISPCSNSSPPHRSLQQPSCAQRDAAILPQSASPPRLIPDMTVVPQPGLHPHLHHHHLHAHLQATPPGTGLLHASPRPDSQFNHSVVTSCGPTVYHPGNQFNGLTNSNPATSCTSPASSILHQPLAVHNQQLPVPTAYTPLQNSLSGPASGGSHMGGSGSGKTTPRQPAKKRLEARTPTIDGVDDPGWTLTTSTGTTPLGNSSVTVGSNRSSTPSLDESNLMAAAGGCSSNMTFRVHQNTPFVLVQGRSGRPSSSGSSCSTGGPPLLTVSAPSTTMLDSLGMHGQHHGPLSHPSDCDNHRGPSLPNLGHQQREHSNDEEEEEKELMDIMVGRSNHLTSENQSNANTHNQCNNPNLGTSSVEKMEVNSAAEAAAAMLANATATYPSLGRSPTCERRAIAMLGALLADACASPVLLGNSVPANNRRSASASSLPYIGSSPNENQPGTLPFGAGRGFGYPQQVQTTNAVTATSNDMNSTLSSFGDGTAMNATHKSPFSTHPWLRYRSKSRLSSAATMASHGMINTPPPPLDAPQISLGVNSGRPSDDAARPLNSALQPLQLNGGELNSGQEIVNLIRQSPASGITPELIDILFNMAQQYGMQQPRAGSRASRSPNQVAQNFYRSLVNGSMCGSPFPTSSGPFSAQNGSSFNFPTCSATPTLTVPDTVPPSGNVLSASPTNYTSSNNNTSCCPTSFNQNHILQQQQHQQHSASLQQQQHQVSHPAHQLRGLSFTPLSVDVEPPVSTTSSEIAMKPHSSTSSVAPSPPPPLYSSFNTAATTRRPNTPQNTTSVSAHR